MRHELELRAVAFQAELPLRVRYKGIELDCGYRVDLLVEGIVVVEFKAVELLHPVHEAQLMTYQRLGRWPVGLLINFHEPYLKDGICRRIIDV